MILRTDLKPGLFLYSKNGDKEYGVLQKNSLIVITRVDDKGYKRGIFITYFIFGTYNSNHYIYKFENEDVENTTDKYYGSNNTSKSVKFFRSFKIVSKSNFFVQSEILKRLFEFDNKNLPNIYKKIPKLDELISLL